MMDRVLGILGYSEGSLKPEILVLYGALAVLITIFVNWALGVVLVMLKPFTCAAILLAFIRPDLAQNFMQEDQLKHVAEKTKTLFCGVFELLLKLGEHFRQRTNIRMTGLPMHNENCPVNSVHLDKIPSILYVEG